MVNGNEQQTPIKAIKAVVSIMMSTDNKSNVGNKPKQTPSRCPSCLRQNNEQFLVPTITDSSTTATAGDALLAAAASPAVAIMATTLSSQTKKIICNKCTAMQKHHHIAKSLECVVSTADNNNSNGQSCEWKRRRWKSRAIAQEEMSKFRNEQQRKLVDL